MATLLAILIAALKVLVPTLITYFGGKYASAATAKSKAEAAELRLAGILLSIAPVAWDKLSGWAQNAFADGKITDAEKAELQSVVMALLPQVASKDNLDGLASDLGVPLSGLVARIVAGLVEKFAKAHDPSIKTESAHNFPVKVLDEVPSLPDAPAAQVVTRSDDELQADFLKGG